MSNFFEQMADVMEAQGYANFGEVMDAAVLAGYSNGQDIDVHGFIAAGAPRPTITEEN